MGIHASTYHEGYLSGHLLIATPALSDGCFDRSVIFLCDHNPHGALGVVINRPIADLGLGEILSALDMETAQHVRDLPVYFGGPVDSHRGLILHTDDKVLEDSVIGSEGIALTGNAHMLKSISQGEGPKHSVMVLGYSGWAGGQLESEIENGSWLTAPATRELVFHTEDELKWDVAAQSLGVDLSRFSSVVGHA